MAMLIHLRSAAYVRAHRADYPHACTIQAAPRLHYGEGLDGSVPLLTPTADEWGLGRLIVAQRREGLPMDPDALAAYRGSMESRWSRALRLGLLRPGRLQWSAVRGMGGGLLSEVPDGAALCCSCSAAEAAAGRCHRAWAAPVLRRAGWSVVLDGVALL